MSLQTEVLVSVFSVIYHDLILALLQAMWIVQVRCNKSRNVCKT